MGLCGDTVWQCRPRPRGMTFLQMRPQTGLGCAETVFSDGL
ncbi:hypothetical protein HMPREF9123_2066 [Neisseria bacilliformis ATCC BAA-1200]|uniref:Uncharacterized protein n=1 Tax=Neisseria bacilliformis ATCC BAA-1200 TaxID=888742 RepID=F2BEB0_9NEIS|nr:hypothetical protein HMPREF9123_2066 [Neisseria bacilliformis ATCC BAA-1200]